MMRPEDLIGQMLGRYRIVRLVGYGGMASVFLAQDIQLRREVAVKVFWPKPGETLDFLRRFAREAQVLAQLDHPNILPIYDYGEHNDRAYLIMPYMAGGSLKDLLQVRRVLAPTEAIRLIAQVLNALQYAHQRGLIHRDIKPGNILLKADGTLLLSDFGLVKVLSAEGDSKSPIIAATQTGQIIGGTPEYMAPEQAMGQALLTSDIYSVGVVLYEMLTGSRPFVADTSLGVAVKHLYEQPPSLRQFNAQVSPQLDATVLRALEKDPTKRYQHPTDFLQALVQATTFEGPARSASSPSWPTATNPAAWSPPPAQQGRGRADLAPSAHTNLNDPQANIETFVNNARPANTVPSSSFTPSSDQYIPTPPPPPHIQPNAGAFTPIEPSPGQYILHPTPRTLSRFSLPSLIGVAVLLLTIFSLITGLFILPQGRSLLGLNSGQTPTNQPTAIVTNHVIPIKGGTWTDDLLQAPTSLIPNGAIDTFGALADQSIWAPLFYGDGNGVIHPGLTTEIPTVSNGDVSSDLKTWTFKLRPNLTWSDGQPLDAKDVDFTWKLWNNPQFGAASTFGFSLIQSTDVSSDSLSITFHLSAPYEAFVPLWTDALYAPLPAHHFSSMAPDAILKSIDNLNPPVTSGPFIMSESKPSDHFTVVRNPKYYLASQGLPYLDRIIFRLIPNQDTILNDFQSGAITSAWFLDVTKVPTYKQLTNYHIASNPATANFEAIYFDLNNPILKDVNIRQAMAMAIDHNALINTARYGQAAPLCTDHGKAYVPGYQADAPCPKFDATAANTLLDQHGWVKGSDGVRSKNGQRLEFKYSTTANNPWRAADEQILQQNFAAIGVKINIQNYPASTFFGSLLPSGKPGQYDLAEFENAWTYDADDSAAFACNQIPSATNGFGGNYSFYCNKQLDALFQQEQSTLDPNQRQQIFNQIHQIYLTDFPFITLYAPIDMAVVKNNVHNYLPGPEGAVETVNVWLWWCDGGHC